MSLRLLDPVTVQQYDKQTDVQANPDGPLALLVCHGMGQQTRFETLNSVANSLRWKHLAEGGEVDFALRFVRFDGNAQLVPRAELTLRSEGKAEQHVHLYEAYWAPLTEGAITYLQAAVFLIKSGWRGFRTSLKGRFERWMFGGKRWLPVDDSTPTLLAALLLVLVPLLIAAGSIVWIGYLVKQAFGASAFSWIGIGAKLPHVGILALVLWLLWKIRKFVLQYIGDVAIYVTSHEVNGFWAIRHAIKQTGNDLAQHLYRTVEQSTDGWRFAYSKVVFAGHSLGSLVAYDTLNEMIRADQLEDQALAVLPRSYALVTFGSPLDKVAFLFRQKLRVELHEILAAGVQPMIQSYQQRPRWWVNVFTKRDIVAGALEYYDDPNDLASPRRVRNFEDNHAGWNPVAAHTDYWHRPPTRDLLYLAATSRLEQLEAGRFDCPERPTHSVKQTD